MIPEYPTPRQIILRLHLVIKKNFRQGKGISDIIKMREIKKIQKQYNNSSGYILNNYSHPDLHITSKFSVTVLPISTTPTPSPRQE